MDEDFYSGQDAAEVDGKEESKADNEEAVPPQIIADVDPGLWIDANKVFKMHCIDCHNQNRRRGYFDLSSHERYFKGGSSGPAVIPGDPGKSRLYTLAKLPADHWDRMPPDGDPLTEEELAALRNWIRAGAPNEHGQITRIEQPSWMR